MKGDRHAVACNELTDCHWALQSFVISFFNWHCTRVGKWDKANNYYCYRYCYHYYHHHWQHCWPYGVKRHAASIWWSSSFSESSSIAQRFTMYPCSVSTSMWWVLLVSQEHINDAIEYYIPRTVFYSFVFHSPVKWPIANDFQFSVSSSILLGIFMNELG